MTEIETTIDNVTPGAVVTIERGAPGKPGHTSFTHQIVSSPGKEMGSHEATVSYVQKVTEPGMGYRITRITRPSLPIPDGPGERFWARWRSTDPHEYIVTDRGRIVDLSDGETWNRDLFERRHAVVPAPEPETVPIPDNLIREADEWNDSLMRSSDVGAGILRSIVRAVREGES